MNEGLNEGLGWKIRERRKELGLTLEQVGQAVGVGRSTVRKWENGMIKNMGRDKISALAKVLEWSPIELVPMDKDYEMLFHRYTAESSIKKYNEIAATYDLGQFPSHLNNKDDRDFFYTMKDDPDLEILFKRIASMDKEDRMKIKQMIDLMFPQEKEEGGSHATSEETAP